MQKLNKPCYMILDLDTNEVLAPFQNYRYWFRCAYDSVKAAKSAIRKMNENEEFKGNYKIVEVIGVEVVSND